MRSAELELPTSMQLSTVCRCMGVFAALSVRRPGRLRRRQLAVDFHLGLGPVLEFVPGNIISAFGSSA
jgi:hypothetical protein